MIAIAVFRDRAYHPGMADPLTGPDRRRKNFEAWMKRRGLTGYAIQQASNVSEGTIRSWLKGDTNISLPKLDVIAEAFGDPVDELIGPGRPMIPVVGIIGAGAEMHPFDDAPMGGGLDEIDAPPGCPSGAVAVEVCGDSMFPDYWPGDVLIYRRDVPFDRDTCLYQDCVVEVQDGPTLVKRVKHGSSPEVLTLESTNAPPRVDQRIKWAAPVMFHDKSRRKRPSN